MAVGGAEIGIPLKSRVRKTESERERERGKLCFKRDGFLFILSFPFFFFLFFPAFLFWVPCDFSF